MSIDVVEEDRRVQARGWLSGVEDRDKLPVTPQVVWEDRETWPGEGVPAEGRERLGVWFVLPERPTGPTGEPDTSARVVGVDDVNATPSWVGGVGTLGVDEDGGVDEDVAHPASL